MFIKIFCQKISPINITTIYNSISDNFFDTKFDKEFIEVVREVVYKYNLNKEYCVYFGRTDNDSKKCQLQRVMKTLNISTLGVDLEKGLTEESIYLASAILDIRKQTMKKRSSKKEMIE